MFSILYIGGNDISKGLSTTQDYATCKQNSTHSKQTVVMRLYLNQGWPPKNSSLNLGSIHLPHHGQTSWRLVHTCHLLLPMHAPTHSLLAYAHITEIALGNITNYLAVSWLFGCEPSLLWLGHLSSFPFMFLPPKDLGSSIIPWLIAPLILLTILALKWSLMGFHKIPSLLVSLLLISGI